MYRIFSWQNLVSFIPNEHNLNVTAYGRMIHHGKKKAKKLISNSFLEDDNKFIVCKKKRRRKRTSKSPDLNPIEHLWDVDMVGQPTNLCDTIMSIWTQVSKECFQNLVKCMPQRSKAALKAKGGPTFK